MRLAPRELLRRHLGSKALMSIVIGVLVAATVFVLAAAPRALVQLGTQELRYEVAAVLPERTDLSGATTFGLTAAPGDSAASYLGPVDAFVNSVPNVLESPLADGAGAGQWILRSRFVDDLLDRPQVTEVAVQLAVDLSWKSRVRIIDGEEPKEWSGSDGDPIDMAISRDAAEALEVSIGDLLTQSPYRVAAIYEPLDPTDGYWRHARDLLQAAVIVEPGSPLRIQASGYINPESAPPLATVLSAGEFSAWIPIDGAAYSFDDIELLASQVRNFTSSSRPIPNGGALSFRSSLDDVLAGTKAKVSSTMTFGWICCCGRARFLRRSGSWG